MPDYEAMNDDLIGTTGHIVRRSDMEYYDKTVLNAEDPKDALGEWWDEMQYRRIYAHENKLIRPLSLLIEMLHMIELAYRVFDNNDNPIDFWLEQLTPEERKKYKL